MEEERRGFESFAVVFKRPHFVLRLISLVFSIIVAACISNDAWEKATCQFNGDAGACNYGMAVGVLSCCTVVVFCIIDLLFDRIGDSQMKRMIILADIIFFGLWSFLWFVCFCYLADSWRKTTDGIIMHGWSGMKASIAFSFFSILTCGSLAVSACVRYQQGIGDDFMSGYVDQSGGSGGGGGGGVGGGVGQPAAMRSSYSSLPPGNTFGRGAQLPTTSDSNESDTKPLTSEPAYQSKSY